MITGKLTREELIRVAGEAKPTAKLREKFQYQNIMFTAAGEIVSKVQKQPGKVCSRKDFQAFGDDQQHDVGRADAQGERFLVRLRLQFRHERNAQSADARYFAGCSGGFDKFFGA